MLSPEEEFALTGASTVIPNGKATGRRRSDVTRGLGPGAWGRAPSERLHGTTPGQERGGRACHRRGARLPHVKVGAFDIDGILRGKYVSREKFLSALEGGFGFCDVVLGWDCQDQLYDNVKFTGWHTGYPDAPVRILPDSCRPPCSRTGDFLPGRVRATGRDRLPPRTAAG